jgi:elongation factor Ts
MAEMPDIPARLVKQLRDETGAGFMDAKRALQETNGDIEAAKRLLREKGLAKAAARGERTTTEGTINYTIADDHSWGAMVAVGCETEPVANNVHFLDFTKKLLEAVVADGPDSVQRFEAEATELNAQLGENITIVGAARFQADGGELVSGYAHPPALKIGVLVKVRGANADAARRLAMHIASAAPAYRSRDDVPVDVVAAERDVYLASEEVQSKPEQAREKIAEGMLQKRFFAAHPGGVLHDQAWIYETSKTVAQALEEEGLEVVEFVRFSVGG